jgi:hypothetical protein
MKLTSTQITGLLAVIGFGGFLIAKLLMPHDPDRLPSGVRLSDLPTIDATTPPDSTPPPDKPLEVGSQEARDDLYCSGVVFATQLESASSDLAEGQKRIDAYSALAENGRAKLVAEKAVTESNAIVVGNAWADKARADFKTNALAIPLDKCLARLAAKAKPAPSPH